MSDADAQLVLMAQAGDHHAFGRLADQQRPALLRLVRRFAPSQDDAEDLVQSALVTAFERLGSLECADKFDAWLRSIALNAARQWRRRSQQLTFVPLWDELPAPRDPAPATLSTALAEAMDRLIPQEQWVVRRHYLDGYTYDEIGAQLRLPPSTVRGRLHRARGKLRTALEAFMAPSVELEMDPMAEEQTFSLSHDDLRRLRAAGALAESQTERPGIRGVWIGSDGVIAATEGCRLLRFSGSSIRPARPIVVGCRLFTARPAIDLAQSASLSISGDRAHLRLQDPPVESGELGTRVRQEPLLNSSAFAPFEKVIPSTTRISMSLIIVDLLLALDEAARLDSFLASIAAPSAETAGPRVRLHLAVDGPLVVERFARKDALFPTQWRLRMEVPAGAECSAQGEAITIDLDRRLLQECVQWLCLDSSAQILLGANGSLQPLTLRSVSPQARLAVLMPMHPEE